MSSSIINSPIAGCMRWGAWGSKFNTEAYHSMISGCLDNGITAFDHADIYGDYTTEADFGATFKSFAARRDQIQIISKCGIQMLGPNRVQHTVKSYNTSKEHIISSAERSLQNLHTDYLDLLLIHRPNPLMHPDEIAEAVNKLKSAGKIRHFGVSNFLPHQVTLIEKSIPVEFNQLEVSIVYTDPLFNGQLDQCIEKNIVPMAWSPLGGNIFSNSENPTNNRVIEMARKLTEKYTTTVSGVLIAWLYAHPSQIIPVMGTSQLERMIEAKEVKQIQLSKEDWFKLLEASRGIEVA
ncbi:MAG: aldo/keto reductase [Bacteroidota bacterium]